MSVRFEGRFFDGASASSSPAVATFREEVIDVETPQRGFTWAYKDILVLDGQSNECRLGCVHEPDAVLVLPAEAKTRLRDQAPDFHGLHVGARRFAVAIAVMIGAAVLVAAILFIGVPAASGPMARATPKDFEMRMGANMRTQIQLVFRPCASDEAMDLLTPVIEDMAAKGEVGFETINIDIVRSAAPNAFALAGANVMATSGFVDAVGDDQEAFLAVMAHELGHVKSRDSMKVFYQNIGLGFLLEAITGGSGLAQQAVLVSAQLTQLRHSRKVEEKADETAFEIMEASGMDPAALARAFEAIIGSDYAREHAEDEEKSGPFDFGDREMPIWLSTHPDTDARIAASKARAASEPTTQLPFTDEEWGVIRAACSPVADNEAAEAVDANTDAAQ